MNILQKMKQMGRIMPEDMIFKNDGFSLPAKSKKQFLNASIVFTKNWTLILN